MAKGTGARRHIHKYFRLVTDGLWHCAERNCTHFMPGNMPPPTYKDSICWTCNLPMQLDPDNMMSTHPVHARCEPFVYNSPESISEETLESMEEYTERKLREARMKKYIPEKIEGAESEVVHTSECASYLGHPCDCGAE